MTDKLTKEQMDAVILVVGMPDDRCRSRAERHMEEARNVAETVLRNLPDDYGDVSLEVACIARALATAERRGMERERERITEKARQWAGALSPFVDDAPYKVMSDFANSLREGE